MKVARMLVTAAAIVAALSLASSARSQRAPWPAWWLQQAMCIHHYEAAHDAPSDVAAWPLGWHNKSNPSSRGGMQFLYGTWARALRRHGLHYTSEPADATKTQQLYVAWLLWNDDHGSWHEWATAAGCGLR
jgi:hypothetical protein